MKKVLILVLMSLALCGCSKDVVELSVLPKPELSEGIRGEQFGIDKNINEKTIDKSIKNIFGDKVKYQKQDFENTNVSIFSAYNKVLGTIEYTGGLYSGFEVQDEEQKMVPLIYQEIQKAEQYTDKVIVYVKTAFIDVENEKYSIYRNFDNNFYGELQKISEYDLFGENSFNKETGEGSIVNKNNINLDSIREQLNTYKYTFSLNQKTGEYFLSEFNKEIK